MLRNIFSVSTFSLIVLLCLILSRVSFSNNLYNRNDCMKVNEKEIVKNRKWLLPLQLGETLEWAKAM